MVSYASPKLASLEVAFHFAFRPYASGIRVFSGSTARLPLAQQIPCLVELRFQVSAPFGGVARAGQRVLFLDQFLDPQVDVVVCHGGSFARFTVRVHCER